MSTLSSVTDGQLCDDASTPGCAPKIVVQQSGAQAVVASSPTIVSTQSGGATILTSQNNAQVVVGGTQAPQIVVNNQTQRIVTTGQQGIQGAQGDIGPSGGVAESRIASEDLGGHRVVRSTGAGTAGYASSDNVLHGDDTLGMTLGAVSAGGTVSVLRVGPVTHAGWAWTAGEPVFLGLNGLPTQTAPETGFAQVIGHAESATTLFLSIEPTVYF